MRVKIDFHVHTTNSRDGHTPIDQIPQILKAKGLNGIAITDHNVNSNQKIEGYITIPGIEISTLEGHIIGLGIMDPIPKKREALETVDIIHSQGGLAVIPHPYDIISPSIDPKKIGANADAIEVANATAIQPFHLKKIYDLAKNFNLTKIGGSDSHIPQTIGDAYTIVEVEKPTVKDVLKSIKLKHTKVIPGNTTIYNRLLKIKKDLFKNVRYW